MDTDEATSANKEEATNPNEDDELHLFMLGHNSRQEEPVCFKPPVNGVPIWMELDTGAEVSVIPETAYKSLFSDQPLTETAVILKTFTGESIPIVGELSAKVESICSLLRYD